MSKGTSTNNPGLPHSFGSAAPLRILLVTERTPGFDNGSAIRVDNVIEGLRSAGDLTVLLVDNSRSGAHLPLDPGYRTHRVRTQSPPRWTRATRILHLMPANVSYRSRLDVRDAIGQTLGRRDWDLVWCNRARVHLLTDGVISGPRIVDLDDLNDRLLQSEIVDRKRVNGAVRTLPRSLRDWLDIRLWRRLQQRIAASVERVVVCSADDCRHLAAPNCVAVPNGYPEPPEAVHAYDRRPCRQILFVGAMTYEPNRLGVEWFVNAVLPTIRSTIPDVEFTVVGDHEGISLTHARTRGVTFTGVVSDVTDYYSSATIAVAPLHSGGGTRLKVLEALARSVSLVATPFACQGHGLTAGKELMVADDAAEFARACCDLLSDGALRTRLEAAGRQRFTSGLTSSLTSSTVCQLAVQVASSHRAGGGTK